MDTSQSSHWIVEERLVHSCKQVKLQLRWENKELVSFGGNPLVIFITMKNVEIANV